MNQSPILVLSQVPTSLPPHPPQGRRPEKQPRMTLTKRIAADHFVLWFTTGVALTNLQFPISNLQSLGCPLETKSSGNHNTLRKAERYLS